MKIKSLLITAVLATAILCSGGIVQATDNSALIAQLQAQIAVLMAQIQAIQAQQGTSQTWCYTFNNVFGVGSSGGDLNSSSAQKADDIRSLRTALINSGIPGASSLSNGNTRSGGISFDELYASAVVKFQAKYGINQTGYVGPITKAKLNTLYGCVTQRECVVDANCPQLNAYGPGPNFPTNKCISGKCVIVSPTCTPNWQCYCGSPKDSNNCGIAFNGQMVCPQNCEKTPSITVTSPNGGEQWAQGTTQTIRWSGGNGYVGIYLYLWSTRYLDSNNGYGNPVSTISPNSIPASQGQYSWTIPVSLAPNQYYIRLTDNATAGGGSDNSDAPFNIVAHSAQPSGMILFYGNGCPHCVNVDNYITDNNITQKVSFTKLEVFSNGVNAGFMQNDANTCGLNQSVVGVPFLWDGNSKCYIGDTDVINFFSRYVSPQPSITVVSPNGGEQWQVGQQVKIRWKTTGLDQNISTLLAIMDDRIPNWQALSLFGSSPVLNYATLVSSVGGVNTYEYNFIVPENFNSSLPQQYQNIYYGNHYKIQVIVLTGGAGGTSSQQTLTDWSDNSFGIVVP